MQQEEAGQKNNIKVPVHKTTQVTKVRGKKVKKHKLVRYRRPPNKEHERACTTTTGPKKDKAGIETQEKWTITVVEAKPTSKRTEHSFQNKTGIICGNTHQF